LKKNSTENLERIAIAASVIGTVIAALSSQAVYAAMPITLSLFLNLVNRNDVKKHTQNLTEQVKGLTKKLNDVSINLGNSQQQTQNNLNNVSIDLGNFQQQTQNNFDSLNSRIEKIPDLIEQVESLNNKLNDVSINLGNSQQQTQNNFASLNSRIEKIPDLTEQVENLTDELNHVSVNLSNSQQQIQNNFDNFDSLNSKVEKVPNLTERIENLVVTLNNLSINLENNIESKFQQTNQILTKIEPHRYELIYGRPDIRDKLRKALREANQTLIMVCPWVSMNALDAHLTFEIEKALKRDVKIHIGWGNLNDINGLNPRPHQGKVTQALLTNNRYDGIKILEKFCNQYNEYMYLKLLGTHEKFLICDDNWALITSHNFLLSSDFSPKRATETEKEIGLLTYDKNIIANLVKHYHDADDRA
jgi:predicted  nucleic acid-binding Zn-ribbon protein